MTPRPRKASDEEVFRAAERAMMRLGPAQLTLAEIAREAGVTAGALVQRFGSKRALQLALAERSVEAPRAMIRRLRETHPSPLAALYAYADCFARMAESPGMLAHHLAYLQVDLTDPDFHRHTRAMAVVAQDEIRALLADAVADGEIAAGTDLDELTRLVQVAMNGSLLGWAVFREGTAEAWMRADLAAVLRPFAPTGGGGGDVTSGASDGENPSG